MIDKRENQKIIKNIELLGERYCEEHIYNKWNKQDLEDIWWEALKFFFSRSFMRGRKDKLSYKYYRFTVEVLEKAFSIDEKSDESYKILKKHEQDFDKQCVLDFKQRGEKKRRNAVNSEHLKDFKREVAEDNRIVELLIEPKKIREDGKDKKKVSLGNDEDIMMVLDVLKFISNEKQNVYNYLKEKIGHDGAEATYDELKGLRGIGDKIASFLIRDISLINPEIVNDNYNYKKAFPVDTWVRQVAKKLKLNDKTDIGIKTLFISECLTSKADPLKVAAGLWYMGSHSLDILIKDCLCVVDLTQRR